MFGAENANQSPQECWKNLSLGYKFHFIIALAFALFGILIDLPSMFACIPPLVFGESFQIWRIFTSILSPIPGLFGFLSVLINFLWLFSILPQREKSNSTAFILIEPFIFCVLINIIFVCVGLFLYYIVNYQAVLFSIGWFPITMIYIWKSVEINPDEQTRFCCFPCTIPRKFIPWILTLFSLLISSSPLPVFIGCMIGFAQSLHLKRSIIRLPYVFYRKLDGCLPSAITQREDYTPINGATIDNLKKECFGGSTTSASEMGGRQPRNQNYMREEKKAEIGGNMEGKGTTIGGANIEYKSYWEKQGQSEETGKTEEEKLPELNDQPLEDKPNEKSDPLI